MSRIELTKLFGVVLFVSGLALMFAMPVPCFNGWYVDPQPFGALLILWCAICLISGVYVDEPEEGKTTGL